MQIQRKVFIPSVFGNQNPLDVMLELTFEIGTYVDSGYSFINAILIYLEQNIGQYISVD